MIPKVIHYVWLSGEAKPNIYIKCLQSWQRCMPDFEIKEWSLNNLPKDVIKHPFVLDALKNRKWAFATDYIRLWVLYNFGGIYMDLDVLVFKNFTPFLKHNAFSCLEFYPKEYIKDIRKRNLKISNGLNIEAAVIGSVKNHPWIKRILDYYDTLKFNIKQKELLSLVMPKVISKISEEFGFKYLPIYQVLTYDVHIYPSEVFSSFVPSNDIDDKGMEFSTDAIKYSSHLCAHSWYDLKQEKNLLYNLKHLILKILGKKTINVIKKFIKGNNLIK